jgi:hypothetical protein
VIVLSLNVRGVGGAHKMIALKRLFSKYKPNIILMQKTMCEGKKAIEILSNVLKDWSFYYVDVEGWSCGLVTSWNNGIEALSSSF